MRLGMFTTIALMVSLGAANAQYLGNYSANPTLAPAPPQLPGTFNNQFGSDYSSPKLYDSQGQFRGNVNSNQFDPNSIANPFGRYGSQFSPDSVNNQFGQYGSQFSPESPNNQFGTGLSIYGPNR